MTAGWDSLMRVDAALRMIDDTTDAIEAPAVDLAMRIDGVERIAVNVGGPARMPRNQCPVLEARVLAPIGVADVVEIARDSYLSCLALIDGVSTNGNDDCDPSVLAFARGATERLRGKESAGLIDIDRFEPTRNIYSSYMGWWEGNGPKLENGLLTLTPSIGS